MRALAHPLRLRILGLLRVEGPKSVGMLVEATGAASGSVSYHLATLAKHGFVVPPPELERDGRERWWRSSTIPSGVRRERRCAARCSSPTTASCSRPSTPR